MTDLEFDIMDELYFVKTYEELSRIFCDSSINFDQELWNMLDRGWIKALDAKDNEVVLERLQFFENKKLYRFNATKKGLLAHNQI